MNARGRDGLSGDFILNADAAGRSAWQECPTHLNMMVASPEYLW